MFKDFRLLPCRCAAPSEEVKREKAMSQQSVLIVLASYFALLLVVAWLSALRSDSHAYFVGRRKAPWWAIAFGMIGVSISGISFISVPGWPLSTKFHYMQMVLGYIVGYYAIAYILIPIYYKLHIPSIYTYLDGRFGRSSYRTGAILFIVSRMVVAAFRLFVVASVLHSLILKQWGVPFAATVAVTIALIWLYTHRAGIQTIIWTDMVQTVTMIACLVLTVYFVAKSLNYNLFDAVQAIASHPRSAIFEFNDWRSPNHFVKQFLSGALIPVVMTGLDQDMMQKNLGCKDTRDAQKNMIAYGYAFVPINLILLSLGLLLVLYYEHIGLALPARGDELYPLIATNGSLPAIVGILFVLGVTAAAYSSADSALTALTTSCTLDLIGADPRDTTRTPRIRMAIQIAVSVALGLLILLFSFIKESSIINALFSAVGYTYGPLLGLYALGLFTKAQTREWAVPVVAVLSPLASWGIKIWAAKAGYQMGYELLLFNGALTFAALWITRRRGRAALQSTTGRNIN